MTNINIINSLEIPEPMSTILTDYILQNINKPLLTVSSISQKPIQSLILQEKFKEEIQYDIKDFYDSWRGTAIHAYLENIDRLLGLVVNESYPFTLSGIEISGTIDSYNPKTEELRDYKYTRKKKDSNWNDYSKQLDFYEVAMLLSKGIELKTKTLKVLRSNPTRFTIPFIYDIDVPLCNLRKTIKQIKEKTINIVDALNLSPEELSIKYPCSKKDMWINTFLKVKKTSTSSAYKGGVFNISDYPSLEAARTAAEDFLATKDEGIIVTVEDEPKRCSCAGYCPGRDYCNQRSNII